MYCVCFEFLFSTKYNKIQILHIKNIVVIYEYYPLVVVGTVVVAVAVVGAPAAKTAAAAATSIRSIPSNWIMELPRITICPKYWPVEQSSQSSNTTFKKAS